MRLQTTLLTISLTGAAMTGCAGLNTLKSPAKPELSQAAAPVGAEGASAEGVAKVDIIFQPEKGQPQRLERSLTEATTVQQLLVQSKANKKYRRFEVLVARRLPSGRYHEIPCEYDREQRQITPANDIALMPGDRVVVTEDTSTVIDDIVKATSGDFTKRFSTGGKHKTGPKFRVEG